MENTTKTLRDTKLIRWTVLVLISLALFGTYWFYDFFAGLKPLMMRAGISSADFGRILRWTTFANVGGMVIVGGIILDKWGIRISAIIFGAFAVAGASLTALGASGAISSDISSQVTIMMIGRLFFGAGIEMTCVIINRTIVKWFKGYELAMAFAINVAFGRLGTSLATAFSVDIAGGQVSPAVTFAASLVALGFIGFLIYLFFDYRLDKQNKSLQQSGESFEDEKFKLSDLAKLVTNRSFILITLLCVVFYSAVFPFNQYAADLLINKYGFSYELDLAGLKFGEKLRAIFSNGPKVASLIALGTILFTPLFGWVVDKKGKAATLMIFGSLLLIFAHLSLSVFNNVILGYCGLLSLGIAFSLVPAAMWPSVPKIVAENRLGTAFALMFTFQNWGLGFFYERIGTVLDKNNPDVINKIEQVRSNLEAQGLTTAEITDGVKNMQLSGEIPPFDYTIPILWLVGLGVISIVIAYFLKRDDKIKGLGIELPNQKD